MTLAHRCPRHSCITIHRQVEDENEKSAAQEIAAVKQRLVDSRDALAALIKKTTRQKQYNDKLRSKVGGPIHHRHRLLDGSLTADCPAIFGRDEMQDGAGRAGA